MNWVSNSFSFKNAQQIWISGCPKSAKAVQQTPGGCFTKMLSALIVVLKVKIYKIQNTKSHWWITSSARHLPNAITLQKPRAT